MLPIKKTYTDFNGTERTETFYFHLNEVELAEMQNSKTGGLDAAIQRIIETNDQKETIQIIKDILLKSYGRKTEDGRGFVKNAKTREELEASPVFPELFMEIANDDEKATKFFEGILPKKAVDAAKQAQKSTVVPIQKNN